MKIKFNSFESLSEYFKTNDCYLVSQGIDFENNCYMLEFQLTTKSNYEKIFAEMILFCRNNNYDSFYLTDNYCQERPGWNIPTIKFKIPISYKDRDNYFKEK